jgi:hypothetical protein
MFLLRAEFGRPRVMNTSSMIGTRGGAHLSWVRPHRTAPVLVSRTRVGESTRCATMPCGAVIRIRAPLVFGGGRGAVQSTLGVARRGSTSAARLLEGTATTWLTPLRKAGASTTRREGQPDEARA